MSSQYRTTVISGINQWEEEWIAETLHTASFIADTYAETRDKVKIDEVLQDACGDYITLNNVMEYVQEAH